jgi:hypothetical protein
MIKYFLDDLGIVFYTNMVQYPNVLSVQVLPNNLKHLAIQRLEFVRDRVPEFKYVKEHPILLDITRKQISGIINFIKANDRQELWDDCIKFNHKLDATRNQSFTDVTPEFKRHV